MADSVDKDVQTTVSFENRAAEFFWHEGLWMKLTRDLAVLPHALLLHGVPGAGKTALAWRLASTLLCESLRTGAAACGACPSCRRFSAGTHPDFREVRPIGDSTVISVDQIRETGQFCVLTPHTAKRKVVLIDPADAMNMNASNAFLKVLEEPPASCFLMLITARPARLPATIRSRCVSIPVKVPRRDESVRWLQSNGVTGAAVDAALDLAGSAPLRALQVAQTDELSRYEAWSKDVLAVAQGTKNPLSCVRAWTDHGIERCLGWFQRYVAERIAMTVSEVESEENAKYLKALFQYSDVLSDAKNLASGPLDASLLLEDVVVRWSRLSRPVG